MAVTKQFLSAASASGGKYLAMATGPTTIHTAVSGASKFDEVFVYAHNTASVALTLTTYWGATGFSTRQTIPSRDGWYVVGGGAPLGLGKLLKGLATGGANKILVQGWVNRIV